MGTRSLTFVYDEGNRPLLNLYRQFDGYPSGHGVDLANFLNGLRLVNGYGIDKSGIANGMGCLAAQLVAQFKDGVGQFYIRSIDDTDLGQDFEYHVYPDRVIIKDPTSEIFSGTWKELVIFCSVKETV